VKELLKSFDGIAFKTLITGLRAQSIGKRLKTQPFSVPGRSVKSIVAWPAA
jgi:hypothetical protein